MRRIALAALTVLAPVWLAAQSSSTPTLEVASVKLADQQFRGGPRPISQITLSFVRPLPGGSFESYGQTLRNLIAWAYEVNTTYQRLEGKQEALDLEYVIAGKTTATSMLTSAELKAVMRSLLQERFRLRVRMQPRDIDGYEMVPARDDRRPGRALRPFTGDCDARADNPAVRFDDPDYEAKARCAWTGISGRQRGIGQTLADVAGRLTGFMAAPVADRTGWTGRFTFDVTGSTDAMPLSAILRPPGLPARATTTDEPQLLEVFRNEIGVKLVKTRATINDLIVERAEPLIEN